MKRLFLVLFAFSCVGLSSCRMFYERPEPKIIERQPAPLLGKPLCVDRILFYDSDKFTIVIEDNDDFRRIRREIKEILTEKLREAGFSVEECAGLGADQLHLEIAGCLRSELFGLINFIVARVRAYDHPVDFSDNWVFEIANIEEPIAGTSENQIRKTANALVAKIVAELKKKAQATPNL